MNEFLGGVNVFFFCTNVRRERTNSLRVTNIGKELCEDYWQGLVKAFKAIF
jgi:hypothetical protein